MSPPTPPSPPIISRHAHDDDEKRTSSRSYHRTARDSRISRSRSRGRGRRTPERRYNQRTHSRSRSRDTTRYARRRRAERSPSKSRVRSDRNRSRSYSKTHKSSYKSRSRSRSHSRSRKRHNRSRSGSKSVRERDTRSRSKHREDRGESSKKQANVIVLSTESYKDSLKYNSRLPSVREEPSSSSSSNSYSKTSFTEETPAWKRAKVDQVGVYSNLKPDAPIDKEKIHKEIEEKLRLVLAREGKVYPYPKPEPSHPVFANDGSFLEIFKKMQQQQTFVQQQVGESMQIHAVPSVSVTPSMPVAPIHQPPPPQLPVFGRRRGGKILKTGVVAKPQSSNDNDTSDVKDFWSIYLREVKKYKSTACESDSKTRPLVR